MTGAAVDSSRPRWVLMGLHFCNLAFSSVEVKRFNTQERNSTAEFSVLSRRECNHNSAISAYMSLILQFANKIASATRQHVNVAIKLSRVPEHSRSALFFEMR